MLGALLAILFLFWAWRRTAGRSLVLRSFLMGAAFIVALLGYTIVNKLVSDLSRGATTGQLQANPDIAAQAAAAFNEIASVARRVPEGDLKKVIENHKAYGWGCDSLMLTKGETIAYRGKDTIIYRPANPPLTMRPSWIPGKGIREEIEYSIQTEEQIIYALAAIAGSLVCERDGDVKEASLPVTKSDIATNYANWGVYLFSGFVKARRN